MSRVSKAADWLRTWVRALAIPVIFLVAISAAQLLNEAHLRQQTRLQAEQVLEDAAEMQTQLLDAVLQGQYQTLETFAASIAVQESVDIGNICTRMTAIVGDSAFQHLFYTTPAGVAHMEDGQVLDVSARAYFQEAMKGKRAVEWLERDQTTDTVRFVMAVPIRKGEQVVGVIQGQYNEQHLRQLLSSGAYRGEAYTTICSQSGQFIIGSDNPKFTLSGVNFFTALAQGRSSGKSMLDQVRKDLSEGRGGSFEYWQEEHRQGRRLVVYRPLGIVSARGEAWFILNVIPGEVLDREAEQTSGTSALLFTFIMLSSAVTLLFIILRERKNAKRLSEDQEKLRVGEAQFRIAAELGGRLVSRYDIRTHMYYNENEMLRAQGYSNVIPNIPEAFIENGAVSPDSAAEYRRFYDRICAGEPHCEVDVQFRNPSGQYEWFHGDATTIFDKAGQPSQAIVVFYNNTEQREKEAVYRKWQQSLEDKPLDSYTLFRCNLSRNSPDDSREGNLLKLEFDPESNTFESRTREYADRFIYPADREAYLSFLDSDTLLASYYRGSRALTMEYREGLTAETVRWLRLTVDMVEYPNSSEIEAYLMFEDIDKAKRAALLTQELAETDPLTGVLNRATFSSALSRMLRDSRKGAQHALMMLDIDGFKLLNDVFGHAAGDQALIEIANALRSVLRHGDLLGRLGGDEFLVCLWDVPYDAVIEKKARQICALLRKTYSREVTISASIGVVVWPRDGTDFDTLYRKADKALYTVKESGRNSFAFFREEMEDAPARSGIVREQAEESAPVPAVKRRMLIVDDNEINLQILTNLFQGDFRVDQARDGGEALVRLRHYGASLSVLLLDLLMPGIDGFTVLERMQSSPELKSIPVIVVSGESERETSLRAIKCGAADYITKPVDPDLIRLRVQAAISKSENERLRAQNSYLLLQSGEEAKYRTVLESTGTLVVEYDWLSGVFTYDAAIGRSLAGQYDRRGLWDVLLQDKVAAEADVTALEALVRGVTDAQGDDSGDQLLLMKTPAGESHWFRVNVFKRTDEFKLSNKLILTFNDVNDEMKSQEQLRFQAERDELTTLYNRRTFLKKTEKLVREKPAGTYILSVGDIDGFKAINDRLGHAEGDRLLCRLAEKLRVTARELKGLCGRMGNDLFALLLPNTEPVRRSMDAYVRQLMADTMTDMELSCSVGCYTVDDPALSADSMLDRAALAKQTIKGSYAVKTAWYDETMRQTLLREQAITAGMEAALAAGQFEVYLQPQYNHTSGRIYGAEALVRWRHPERGMIPPSEFVPLFERNGFITRLDNFVWERTAALMHAWREQGLELLPVSVNVSRQDTDDPQLCDKLSDILTRYDIPRQLFRLEITESLFVENTSALLEVVTRLQERGFIIEMDDFGSGYSSLNILKDIPVDILKMDMRFFSASGDPERSSTILNAVMRMARWLDIPVVAEGVELRQQADHLASIGCKLIQGYLYARPMPPEEFVTLLSRGGVDTEPYYMDGTPYGEMVSFWREDSADTLVFTKYIGPAVVYEYRKGILEAIRSNQGFIDLMRFTGHIQNPVQGLLALDQSDVPRFFAAADRAVTSGKAERVFVRRVFDDGSPALRLRYTLRAIAREADSAVIFCMVEQVN